MGFFDFLKGGLKGKKTKSLTTKVTKQEIEFFERKAEEKIRAEGWFGRRVDIKRDNFVNCWLTEEAFKKILMKKNIWFRHRGMYVGDASGSTDDFQVKINGETKTLGIRSIGERAFKEFKQVAYPDDRFRLEKERIADFTIACYKEKDKVSFLGIIPKRNLLEELSKSRRIYSKMNQEYFRVVDLKRFDYPLLVDFLDKLDKFDQTKK